MTIESRFGERAVAKAKRGRVGGFVIVLDQKYVDFLEKQDLLIEKPIDGWVALSNNKSLQSTRALASCQSSSLVYPRLTEEKSPRIRRFFGMSPSVLDVDASGERRISGYTSDKLGGLSVAALQRYGNRVAKQLGEDWTASIEFIRGRQHIVFTR